MSSRSPLLSALKAKIPFASASPTEARIFLYSLLVRVLVDLILHRPYEFGRSDMGGYISRAAGIFDRPIAPEPIATFFPYGTHVMLYAVEQLFGRNNFVAVALLFGALGAIAVTATYATAKRVLDSPRAALALGLFLSVYPSWIYQGAFVLSETPLSAAVALSTFFAVRLFDDRQPKDAWRLGVVTAIGATFRPQLLLFLPLLAVVMLVHRKRLFGESLRLPRVALALALPAAIVVGGSIARTEYHTDHFGTVSTNGAFNFALGRCHAVSITAERSPGGTFTPPSFHALDDWETHFHETPLIPLDPAMGKNVSFDGFLWDEAPAFDLAKRCMAASGPWRQIKYSIGNIGLLWAYNVPFPQAHVIGIISLVVHAILFVPGLIVGLAMLFARRDTRRDPRFWVLFVQALGLFFTAIVFFGESRLRLPYDGVLDTFAVGAYLWVGRAIFRKLQTRTRAPAHIER